MKFYIALFFLVILMNSCREAKPVDFKDNKTGALIIDHTCTDITKIPDEWFIKAKKEFGVSYGHTSHGSQIMSGMKPLMQQSNLYSYSGRGGSKTLTIFDREPAGDLGNPDRRTWAERTDYMLRKGFGDVNVVMWSWCGQVSSASAGDINLYLRLMSELEEQFPGYVFIYMTGHLDGSGENGNLNHRNNQIREFCKVNGKILYDFADIESYDPDGIYYLDKMATDGCDYRLNGIIKNWADDWCENNPGECIEYSCAHSKSLNCDLKARAFWWMIARLAGWDPEKQIE